MQSPFHVKEEEIDRGGSWPSTRITIFNADGKELGSYERNYHSFGAATFCPFFLHDRWWALYSPVYTGTRVMILPEAEDWCGEEDATTSFVPVDYYVPRYRTARYAEGGTVKDVYIGENAPGWIEPEIMGFTDVSEESYCPFGLVAGCIWGDEATWKVEYLDLARLPEKRFRRENHFGTLHLLDELSLKEAIDMERWRPDEPVIGIVSKRWQNCKTGDAE